MRITGQGTGGGQSFSGDRDRSDPEAFRRGRRVGQIVRGKLLAPGPNNLFWVVIAGHKLLAALDHEPAPGRELVFRIIGLEPDLILKDITPPPSLQNDPALLLAALSDTRARFEHQLPQVGEQRGFPAPPLDLTAARRAFAAFLAAHDAARDACDRTRECFRLAGSLLPPGSGRLLYTPWMFPGLGGSEALVAYTPPKAGGPSFSLSLFGRLPDTGRILIQASLHGQSLVYRLSVEHPETADALIAALATVRFGKAVLSPVCRFAGPLAAAQAGGLVGPLLAKAARPFTGLRLRV